MALSTPPNGAPDRAKISPTIQEWCDKSEWLPCLPQTAHLALSVHLYNEFCNGVFCNYLNLI